MMIKFIRDMKWLLLMFAGIMEVGCILSLKYSNGFKKLIPVILYSLFGFGSAYLFSLSLKHFRIGVAFLIWFGIAALGITLIEVFYFKRDYSFWEIFFMAIILTGILGLKFLQS